MEKKSTNKHLSISLSNIMKIARWLQIHGTKLTHNIGLDVNELIM